MKNKKILFYLLFFFLLILGFYYRFYGLSENYAFWTDENQTAIFARAILDKGKPILNNGSTPGFYLPVWYYLPAFFMSFLGLNELAARLPSVFFGVASIWAVYILSKQIFNKNIALFSAFLTAFLKIEILWSRQARPYQAVQFFYLLGIFFIYKILASEKFKISYFLAFLLMGILAALVHGSGFVLLFIGLLSILFLGKIKTKIKVSLTLILFFSSFFLFLLFKEKFIWFLKYLGSFNNFYYYRVFLTHHYLWLTSFAFMGILLLFLKKEFKKGLLFSSFLVFQILIISYIFSGKFIRYFYVIFPLLPILSSYFIFSLPQFFKNKLWKNIFLIFLVLCLIFSLKDKLALLPQKVYSLNDDMQEIPEVDYQKIYVFIKDKLDKSPEAVYLSNWNDHAIWYLGEGKLDYLIRYNDQLQNVNKEPLSGASYLERLSDLQKVIAEDKKGLILIESWDDRVPSDMRIFIRTNFKKELEVDRLYPVQPRLWPVEVYSWGI